MSSISSSSSSLLFHGVSSNDLHAVAKLLESDEKAVNAKDATGSTPLICAVSSGHVLMVGLILQYGPDMTACLKKEYGGLSATHLAARQDSVEMIKLINVAKGDMNQRSLTNSTPLIEAARHNAINVVKFLLSVQADPSLVDAHGFSAHYYAKKMNFPEISSLLPPVYYSLIKQLQSQSDYSHQIHGILDTKKQKEKLAERKAKRAEKKKQAKQW